MHIKLLRLHFSQKNVPLIELNLEYFALIPEIIQLYMHSDCIGYNYIAELANMLFFCIEHQPIHNRHILQHIYAINGHYGIFGI